VAYPPRQVNNVYFDTATFTGLNANVDGVGDRAKLRLRWYGDEVTRIADAHLELKRKQGMAGWKESAAITGDFNLTALTWPAFTSALRRADAPEARRWLERFTIPALINAYHRAYYATPDGVLRLTVDTDLHAYDQRASNCPNLRRPAPPSPSSSLNSKRPSPTRLASPTPSPTSPPPPTASPNTSRGCWRNERESGSASQRISGSASQRKSESADQHSALSPQSSALSTYEQT
jgi:hypothetical protein